MDVSLIFIVAFIGAILSLCLIELKKIKEEIITLRDPIFKIYLTEKILLKKNNGVNIDHFYEMYMEKLIENSLFNEEEETDGKDES